MNNAQYFLSKDKKRNKTYASFLRLCQEGNAMVDDIIHLGYKLMRKQRLHHHFFGDRSLVTTAKYLAYYALGISSEQQALYLTEVEALKVIAVFETRISKRIPVEYITNEAIYCGHKFYINESVLVPRSLMSTRFEDFIGGMNWENYRVLDLCSGSGCIGITLAQLHSTITVDLVDISSEALEVAQININNHHLNDRVRCIQSDLFESIQNQYDLIITNPPYVPTKEYDRSPCEFKMEPKIALEAGKRGLNIIDKILSQAKDYLSPNGVLIAEVGFSAAKYLKKEYPQVEFKWYKYKRHTGKESFFGMHCIFLLRYLDSLNIKQR